MILIYIHRKEKKEKEGCAKNHRAFYCTFNVIIHMD